MRELNLNDLALGLTDLLEPAGERFKLLANTKTGALYVAILQKRLGQFPKAGVEGGPRPMTIELTGTDALHDGFGGAFWMISDAYLRAPDVPVEIKKSIETLRKVFLTDGLQELRANYADEAKRAKDRRELLQPHAAALKQIPLYGGKTLYDWVEGFIVNGVKLDALMSQRAKEEAEQQGALQGASAGYRATTIGVLYKCRAALSDELELDETQPRNLDALIFGYLDELNEKRRVALRNAPVTETNAPAQSDERETN